MNAWNGGYINDTVSAMHRNLPYKHRTKILENRPER
jgi:hypothetical protein